MNLTSGYVTQLRTKSTKQTHSGKAAIHSSCDSAWQHACAIPIIFAYSSIINSGNTHRYNWTFRQLQNAYRMDSIHRLRPQDQRILFPHSSSPITFPLKLSAKFDEMQLVITAKDGLLSKLFIGISFRQMLYRVFCFNLDPINLFVLEMDSNGVTSLDVLQTIAVLGAT